jgi:hypothetical protein
MLKKITAFFISFCFAFEQVGFAQVAGQLDISARMSSMYSSMAFEKYRPLHLRYLSYDQLNNDFKLLLDKGTSKENKPEVLEKATGELLKYFFIGIALPNDAFWVNLRPDSPKEIIDDNLAKTDIGKIMLECDLQLKKDTAKYTSPDTLEGRQYWDKLYKRAEELYGSENITIPTLTRPWIVPDEIIVREAEGSAYIYKATLKVMLEQDYLKGNSNYSFPDEKSKILNEYSSQIIRETIIPKLTREVNSSKRYSGLRQVYYSLILAQWFKQSQKGTKSQVTSKIDAKDLSNLASRAKWDKDTYFKAYQKSFKDGEYNIQENRASPYGQTIRAYFSGGEQFTDIGRQVEAGLVRSRSLNLGDGFWSQYYSILASVSAAGAIGITQPVSGLMEATGGKLADGGKTTNSVSKLNFQQDNKKALAGLLEILNKVNVYAAMGEEIKAEIKKIVNNFTKAQFDDFKSFRQRKENTSIGLGVAFLSTGLMGISVGAFAINAGMPLLAAGVTAYLIISALGGAKFIRDAIKLVDLEKALVMLEKEPGGFNFLDSETTEKAKPAENIVATVSPVELARAKAAAGVFLRTEDLQYGGNPAALTFAQQEKFPLEIVELALYNLLNRRDESISAFEALVSYVKTGAAIPQQAREILKRFYIIDQSGKLGDIYKCLIRDHLVMADNDGNLPAFTFRQQEEFPVNIVDLAWYNLFNRKTDSISAFEALVSHVKTGAAIPQQAREILKRFYIIDQSGKLGDIYKCLIRDHVVMENGYPLLLPVPLEQFNLQASSKDGGKAKDLINELKFNSLAQTFEKLKSKNSQEAGKARAKIIREIADLAVDGYSPAAEFLKANFPEAEYPDLELKALAEALVTMASKEEGDSFDKHIMSLLDSAEKNSNRKFLSAFVNEFKKGSYEGWGLRVAGIIKLIKMDLLTRKDSARTEQMAALDDLRALIRVVTRDGTSDEYYFTYLKTVSDLIFNSLEIQTAESLDKEMFLLLYGAVSDAIYYRNYFRNLFGRDNPWKNIPVAKQEYLRIYRKILSFMKDSQDIEVKKKAAEKFLDGFLQNRFEYKDIFGESKLSVAEQDEIIALLEEANTAIGEKADGGTVNPDEFIKAIRGEGNQAKDGGIVDEWEKYQKKIKSPGYDINKASAEDSKVFVEITVPADIGLEGIRARGVVDFRDEKVVKILERIQYNREQSSFDGYIGMAAGSAISGNLRQLALMLSDIQITEPAKKRTVRQVESDLEFEFDDIWSKYSAEDFLKQRNSMASAQEFIDLFKKDIAEMDQLHFADWGALETYIARLNQFKPAEQRKIFALRLFYSFYRQDGIKRDAESAQQKIARVLELFKEYYIAKEKVDLVKSSSRVSNGELIELKNTDFYAFSEAILEASRQWEKNKTFLTIFPKEGEQRDVIYAGMNSPFSAELMFIKSDARAPEENVGIRDLAKISFKQESKDGGIADEIGDNEPAIKDFLKARKIDAALFLRAKERLICVLIRGQGNRDNAVNAQDDAAALKAIFANELNQPSVFNYKTQKNIYDLAPEDILGALSIEINDPKKDLVVVSGLEKDDPDQAAALKIRLELDKEKSNLDKYRLVQGLNGSDSKEKSEPDNAGGQVEIWKRGDDNGYNVRWVSGGAVIYEEDFVSLFEGETGLDVRSQANEMSRFIRDNARDIIGLLTEKKIDIKDGKIDIKQMSEISDALIMKKIDIKNGKMDTKLMRKILNDLKKVQGDGGTVPITAEQAESKKLDEIPVGGIDFRALPIITQPMGEILMKEIINMPIVNIADLEQEWRALQKMVETETCPSSQRIKEFLGACYQKGELKQRADKVLACLAGILRIEEDESKATEPQMKIMLALLESNR